MITDYAITPYKAYGQNFVIKKELIDEMLASAQIEDDETILEIGGGIGTLTYSLLQKAKDVITYEIDPILASVLKKEFFSYNTRLKVISSDFLKEDKIPRGKIVSNLPYSISSPVMWKISRLPNPPKLIVLTLQEEFANHLCAKVGSKDYSRLSVYSSYFYEIEKVLIISSDYFYPQPQVSSCLVKGVSIDSPDIIKEKPFFIFLTALFCRKNKKARNNLMVFQKKLERRNRIQYRNQLDSLEFSQKKSIHLSPDEILAFYLDYSQMIKENFEISNLGVFME
jgi:16S rRNA (adenine1518-N6/adenine1519-N6)-dimethyltransferase